MIDFNIDFDKYLIDSGAYNYHNDVIAYTKETYYKMKNFEREKYLNFFNNNNITLTDFLNVFMSRSQSNFDKKGTEILEPNEINKVFSDLLVYSEFLKFLMEDKMGINAITSDGSLIYDIGLEVRDYFKYRYNVDL